MVKFFFLIFVLNSISVPKVWSMYAPYNSLNSFCYSPEDTASFPQESELQARINKLEKNHKAKKRLLSTRSRALQRIKSRLANQLSSQKMQVDSDEAVEKISSYIQGREQDWHFDNCPLSVPPKPKPQQLSKEAQEKLQNLGKISGIPAAPRIFDEKTGKEIKIPTSKRRTTNRIMQQLLEDTPSKQVNREDLVKTQEKPPTRKKIRKKQEAKPRKQERKQEKKPENKKQEQPEEQEEDLIFIGARSLWQLILPRAQAMGCARFQRKDTSRAFFKKNGRVLSSKFCKVYSHKSKISSCKTNLERLKNYLESIISLQKDTYDMQVEISDLKDDQLLEELDGNDEYTEAQAPCIDCKLHENTNRLGALGLIGSGGLLSYFGLSEAKRSEKEANKLRELQGFIAESNFQNRLLGAGLGFSLIGQGLQGLRQRSPYICSPYFYNNPYTHNPYAY